MNERSTANFLLLIMVIPLVFYILHILSFIFIPLFFSMFIALLFLPLMRWLQRKKLPTTLSILTIVALITTIIYAGSLLIKISFNEIMSADSDFFEVAKHKLLALVSSVE